ncbi:MAG: hypothetical protein ACE5E6_11670 [Phycisphaerae bacterium]
MGFRVGWFGKWGGLTWGLRGGLRLYGMTRGRRKSGCLLPLVALLSGGAIVVVALVHVLR